MTLSDSCSVTVNCTYCTVYKQLKIHARIIMRLNLNIYKHGERQLKLA